MSEHMDATFQADARRVYDDALDVLLAKNAAYGPHSIAAAPGGPINGLLVRLHDKLQRAVNLHANDDVDDLGEALLDTARDGLNYFAIMVLVLQGQWPGVDAPESEAGDGLTPLTDEEEAALGAWAEELGQWADEAQRYWDWGLPGNPMPKLRFPTRWDKA